ncbi:shugoshin 2 [Nannospalax galili]|uniref:shugoshin 2 n=1 Tax=Nannospalax galili TaxID=1026970 RepID=UPI00111C7752|nr:shugoshin 2 [Nannospalax galili]
MEVDSVTSGIKRRVKDRISKTKLNVSLASKIKTKIINNSSIFKISLKHNNRALAQALSREKENARRITTEKMVLQKEVEKLNFENTFLRLKLNNLNKKLIEIESLVNNNLITAIEMSSLYEFHQSSILLTASKKKRISKQCKSMYLPFARVPLTSDHDDDDDDDDDGDDNGCGGGGRGDADKQKTQCGNIISVTSPDIPSSVSLRQPLSLHQSNLEALFPKEDNQNTCGLDHSECISSTVDVLPKESCYHSNQSSKSSLVSEMKIDTSTNCRREKSFLNNVTERKKRGSSWESNNPVADVPCVADLDYQQISSLGLSRNNEISDCTNENNSKMQRNRQCFPDLPSESVSNPNVACMNEGQDTDDFEFQKTVHEDADMDLTASEVSKIITVSKSSKNKSQKNTNCGKDTFRKVKDPTSEKKREKSKRKYKDHSDVDIEEKTENRLGRGSVVLDGQRDSEDPNFLSNTQQLTQANILKKITLQNGFDQDDRQNTQCSKKKQMLMTNKQEETDSLSQCSDKFLQESKFDQRQNTLSYNIRKSSRQTFVISKSEKGNLFPNQKDKDTVSENLGVANEFQAADPFTRDNGNLCDYEAQNVLDLKKCITDTQPTQQNQSKTNKPKQTINRKTEIISRMNQIYDDDKDMHVLEKGNFSTQTQTNKETMSANPKVAKEFQIPLLFTRNNENIHDDKNQNVLGLQKQITDVYPVQQNESKTSKNSKQKVNRKTEIISRVSHFNNDKSVQCSEKDNSFLLQKVREVTPGNLEDLSEFQKHVLCTNDIGNETQTVLGVKKHVQNMQPAYQNDSKIDKKLRQKVHRKTEVISKINHIYENGGKSVYDPDDYFFSLTQEDKETSSENLKVTNELQTADVASKDNRYLYDQEAQSILGLKKHVTNMPLTHPNESKLSKKLRQKVSRTDVISEMNQIYDNINEDANGQKSYVKDLDLKVNKSKDNIESRDVISGYCMEITSNEKENCDQIPCSFKLVKKRRKKSGKAENILTQGKNRPILQLTDSSQASITLDPGLKHITNETDSDPRHQTSLPKNQKHSTVTPRTQADAFSLEVVKEGNCPAKKVNKVMSKSKKRKTLLDLSSDTHEVMEAVPNIDHRKSVDSEQTDKKNYLENEKIAKIKPDFCTKVFKPLSQICSPNIQNSPFDSVHERSKSLSISSSKSLMIEENFALGSIAIIPVSDKAHEKVKEVACKGRRTQRSAVGRRTLPDLTEASFISSCTKPENESEDPSSELTRRKRKCAPLNLKEPKLNSKMRR